MTSPDKIGFITVGKSQYKKFNFTTSKYVDETIYSSPSFDAEIVKTEAKNEVKNDENLKAQNKKLLEEIEIMTKLIEENDQDWNSKVEKQKIELFDLEKHIKELENKLSEDSRNKKEESEIQKTN